MKCFYHSSDLDGHCSGALVKFKYPCCDMHPINYGDKFPFETIRDDERVFMVDFSLPIDEMRELYDRAGHLLWVDHHKTALDAAKEARFSPQGSREIGKGACQLVHEYLYPAWEIPKAVKLLADYDIWDHSNPDTLAFQYGLRMENTDPENQALWTPLIESDAGLNSFIYNGRIVLKYEEQRNKEHCAAAAFTTYLTVFKADGTHDYKSIAVNRGFTNSKFFDSVWDPEQYQLMVLFSRTVDRESGGPGGEWLVSIYTTHDDIDCGAIAKHFGGGGHKQAAGFRSKFLPFDY